MARLTDVELASQLSDFGVAVDDASDDLRPLVTVLDADVCHLLLTFLDNIAKAAVSSGGDL